jgi:chemotaxis protein methyltransferase CheR
MDNQTQDIVLSKEDFEKFREFFYEKTGILFDESKRYFVDRRIIERMKVTGYDNFKSYFIAIKYDISGKELQNLINALTVNETYFFREEYQFQAMVENMLPEITSRKKPGERVRIFSIPSSTGEEPYSIALYLLEYWKDIDKWDVEIVSADIDTNALEAAKQGVYSSRSVQNLPKPILKKYFTPLKDGYYKITDDLINAIEFKKANIVNSIEMLKFRNFDIVFCRNLLIYFDDLSRKKAAETLYNAMNPGGFICLGHAESMSRISSIFEVRRFPKAIVYQKPLEGNV